MTLRRETIVTAPALVVIAAAIPSAIVDTRETEILDRAVRRGGCASRHETTTAGARRGAIVSRGRFRKLGVLLPSVIVLQGCEGLAIPDTASLLVPGFQRSEIVGLVAGFGTTFAALPDLLAMLKRRSSAGMNPRMAGIMCVFQVAWVYYGLLIASRPVVLWNVVAVVINGLSVGAYVHFARKETSRTTGR